MPCRQLRHNFSLQNKRIPAPNEGHHQQGPNIFFQSINNLSATFDLNFFLKKNLNWRPVERERPEGPQTAAEWQKRGAATLLLL